MLHVQGLTTTEIRLDSDFRQDCRYQDLTFRAYHDYGFLHESQMTWDSRLVGRSAWNTKWLLIVPGQTLLYDPDAGLDAFIDAVSDIKLFFQTHACSGN